MTAFASDVWYPAGSTIEFMLNQIFARDKVYQNFETIYVNKLPESTRATIVNWVNSFIAYYSPAVPSILMSTTYIKKSFDRFGFDYDVLEWPEWKFRPKKIRVPKISILNLEDLCYALGVEFDPADEVAVITHSGDLCDYLERIVAVIDTMNCRVSENDDYYSFYPSSEKTSTISNDTMEMLVIYFILTQEYDKHLKHQNDYQQYLRLRQQFKGNAFHENRSQDS